MATSIITTDDLQDFKRELLEEIKQMLLPLTKRNLNRYLKSSEVCDILQISPGTLLNFRINGTLPFTKIGGQMYYDSLEIEKIMVRNKNQYK